MVLQLNSSKKNQQLFLLCFLICLAIVASEGEWEDRQVNLPHSLARVIDAHPSWAITLYHVVKSHHPFANEALKQQHDGLLNTEKVIIKQPSK